MKGQYEGNAERIPLKLLCDIAQSTTTEAVWQVMVDHVKPLGFLQLHYGLTCSGFGPGKSSRWQ
jgi:hypothetical protein